MGHHVEITNITSRILFVSVTIRLKDGEKGGGSRFTDLAGIRASPRLASTRVVIDPHPFVLILTPVCMQGLAQPSAHLAVKRSGERVERW